MCTSWARAAVSWPPVSPSISAASSSSGVMVTTATRNPEEGEVGEVGEVGEGELWNWTSTWDWAGSSTGAGADWHEWYSWVGAPGLRWI